MNTQYNHVHYTLLDVVIKETKIYDAIMLGHLCEIDRETEHKIGTELCKKYSTSKLTYKDYRAICTDNHVLFGQTHDSLWFFYYSVEDDNDCMMGRVDKNSITKEQLENFLTNDGETQHIHMDIPKYE